MAEQGRITLKTYFETGDAPTEAEFIHIIDSMFNVVDDDTTGEGTTANGRAVDLGGAFAANIAIYNTTSKKFEIIVGNHPTIIDNYTTFEVNALGTTVTHNYYPSTSGTPSEQIISSFGISDGLKGISRYETYGTLLAALLSFDTLGQITLKSIDGSHTFNGIAYDADNSSKWGTINSANLFIHHIGWVVSNLAPILTSDENYVTDAEKVVIGNT